MKAYIVVGPTNDQPAPLELLREQRGRFGQRRHRRSPPSSENVAWGQKKRASEPCSSIISIARASVVDRRSDLAVVAHDAGVAEQPLDVSLAEPCHRLDVEPGERCPEVVALAQDRQPRQARLEPLQTELLEQPRVVGDPEPPLGVVIADVVGSRPTPRTPPHPIVTHNQFHPLRVAPPRSMQQTTRYSTRFAAENGVGVGRSEGEAVFEAFDGGEQGVVDGRRDTCLAAAAAHRAVHHVGLGA